MVARGWFKESYRHRLAAQGIKTKYYQKKSRPDITLDLGKIHGPTIATIDIVDEPTLMERLTADERKARGLDPENYVLTIEGAKRPQDIQVEDFARMQAARLGTDVKTAARRTGEEFAKYREELEQEAQNREEELGMAARATGEFVKNIPERRAELEDYLQQQAARRQRKLESRQRQREAKSALEEQEALAAEIEGAYEGRTPTGAFRSVGLREVKSPKQTEKELEKEGDQIAQQRALVETQLERGTEQAAIDAALRKIRTAKDQQSFQVMRDGIPEFPATTVRAERARMDRLRSFNPIEERRQRQMMVLSGRRR